MEVDQAYIRKDPTVNLWVPTRKLDEILAADHHDLIFADDDDAAIVELGRRFPAPPLCERIKKIRHGRYVGDTYCYNGIVVEEKSELSPNSCLDEVKDYLKETGKTLALPNNGTRIPWYKHNPDLTFDINTNCSKYTLIDEELLEYNGEIRYDPDHIQRIIRSRKAAEARRNAPPKPVALKRRAKKANKTNIKELAERMSLVAYHLKNTITDSLLEEIRKEITIKGIRPYRLEEEIDIRISFPSGYALQLLIQKKPDFKVPLNHPRIAPILPLLELFNKPPEHINKFGRQLFIWDKTNKWVFYTLKKEMKKRKEQEAVCQKSPMATSTSATTPPSNEGTESQPTSTPSPSTEDCLE